MFRRSCLHRRNSHRYGSAWRGALDYMRPPRGSANRYFCGNVKPDCCDLCDDGRMSFEVRDGDTTTSTPRLQVVHIYVFGLEPGQCIEIEREWKDECDPLFGPWLQCGKPTILTCDSPETLLTVPGHYRTKHSLHDLDSENVRVQATEISMAFAELRLREHALCCCPSGRNS